MKRFVRTLGGKLCLFFLAAASALILTVCIGTIALCGRDSMLAYHTDEDEFVEEYVIRARLNNYATTILSTSIAEREGFYSFIRYRVVDEKGITVAESEDFAEAALPCYTAIYAVKANSNGIWVYRTDEDEWLTEGYERLTVSMKLEENSQLNREILFLTGIFRAAYALRYAVYAIACLALLLFVFCYAALLYAAGRRPEDDEFHPGPLHRFPFDVLLAAVGLGYLYLLACYADAYFESILIGVLLLAQLVLLGICLFLGLSMSAAGRIKRHCFWQNTLVGWLFSLLKKLHAFVCSLVRGIPLIWKALLLALAVIAFDLLMLIFAYDGDSIWQLLFIAEKLLLLPLFLRFCLGLRRLQKGGDALAQGQLNYQTETRGMPRALKQHGENLNSIAGGLTIAVEERLKSERMKTAMITNVSHDLKTPLTSVINYATLIGQEPCENPKITEYAGVLVRQSDKLKRLIEDLVEASKASTGNLEVLPVPCDPAVFLGQAAGEYEERLKESGLSLVVKQTEQELRIMADGRRMWRIFDNLMNNICKYAQPGTRVYLSLEEQAGNAVISFKNTSRDPLDMSEEELMERFTRGDASRHTEGNGLGLSIAKSMAELQGGSLRLVLDGDLFKAVLSFPLIG